MDEIRERLEAVTALNEQLAVADQRTRRLIDSLDDLKSRSRVLDDLDDR